MRGKQSFVVGIFVVLISSCASCSAKLSQSSNGFIYSIFNQDNSIVDVEEEPEIKPRQQMGIPVVINTWGFDAGNANAWNMLNRGGSALDAVEVGATTCEVLQCDNTVGFGGSPDENGETTLDAMIMDGERHAVGAVGCLRRVKNAVGVARKVLEHTSHTLLVGELATQFALSMGFPEENLTTPDSLEMHDSWERNNCQPNFWRNVNPDPTQSCGPYTPKTMTKDQSKTMVQVPPRVIDQWNHDTIGIVAIDSLGRVASATSSNGARNKIPGRVGDAPIVGAGSYVDKDIGGAAATGDGDIMVRFLPSLLAVEKMGMGLSPTEAAEEAIQKIARFYPTFSGALVAVNLRGEYGAACHGIATGFPYCVSPEAGSNGTIILHANCTSTSTSPANRVFPNPAAANPSLL
ncbi:N(4)-(Beta-N-acetylglucosaminyl)-L-asparaginase isoform X2 [Folsomia candida]|uniref:N(4)-(beta-N-acetylglucosaminyl)-L-asparaginase n=1 Tax=Folsomia candida TaxID=158441 RepID=A0A226E5R9_FOLCA|nr:N(4)-(Beta-N-acetylglucosaminyl)-L-asparaginase isoform X2 [Folsomia candida]OXA52414.1 N(4)-(Beta-N-acetylglucosaminyl)-L-asparaginase [Folsomia candida]